MRVADPIAYLTDSQVLQGLVGIVRQQCEQELGVLEQFGQLVERHRTAARTFRVENNVQAADAAEALAAAYEAELAVLRAALPLLARTEAWEALARARRQEGR